MGFVVSFHRENELDEGMDIISRSDWRAFEKISQDGVVGDQHIDKYVFLSGFHVVTGATEEPIHQQDHVRKD